MTDTFFACNSDLRPVWLRPLTREQAGEQFPEATTLMPTSAYKLVWAVRHGQAARWYVFPR